MALEDRMDTLNERRSLADLVSDLVRETSLLARQEVALAKAEISENLARARTAAIGVAIGAVVAFAGLLVLLDAVVLVLVDVLGPEFAPWVSALIVGVAVLILGLVLLQLGIKRMESPLMPQRTVDSLKRNVEFAKEQVK
jgi:hypothetical protein